MLDKKYLEILYYVLKSKQMNADAWLDNAGLSLIELQNPQKKLSLRQISKLVNLALEYYPNDHLGLDYGKMLDIPTHGNLGQLLLASKTMAEAIEHMQSFALTKSLLVRAKIFPKLNDYIFKISFLLPFAKHKHMVIESAFACMHRIRKTLLQQENPPCELYLNYTPTDLQAYEAYFGANIFLNHKTCEYRFPLDEGKLSLTTHNEIIYEASKAACERELITSQEGTTISYKIRQLLLDGSIPDFKLEATSSALFTSSRTLKRKLQNEGTSFQEIVEEVRKELALDYLQHQNLSVSDTAIKLGYSDIANFNRAFKRWFGESPSSITKSL